ncbi:MAG: histidine phosphatase family protein [Phenylobacterium sp.]|uniref:histidine phosphatase family protein n=1 Tax=Phenylobacterium sp. TaxID=1871053 RepID=UPI0025FE5150|nr:histidine phosphatase family protein [Phenylobacterium sp.]MBA4011768.1 histidine phosphatase family protein [Phenylobacterium sp.]
MATLYFLTHPEVIIDPAVPIAEWGLSDVGRRRMERFIGDARCQGLTAVYSSAERKATDGAAIASTVLGIPHVIDAELGENDRSSTGYLAPPEFWQVVELFFQHPDESIRGWEPARAAQDRIVRAVKRLVANEQSTGDILVVSHGGVGRLLAASLQGVEIGQEDRPAHPGGGCWLEIDRRTLAIRRTWQAIPD